MLSNHQIFPTTQELSEAAAQHIIELAKYYIQKNGRFTISLSGGSTPERLFKLFTQSPYRDQMPWQNTYFFWGDERCVPLNDERNNAYQAIQFLFSKIDIPVENIFRIPTNLTPAEAAEQYEQTIKNFFATGQPRFDLMLLGMGDDGHTASLFPNTSILHEETRLVKEIYIEKVAMYRITMTAPLINLSHHIIFLVTGANKADTLKKVLHGHYEPELYPSQFIKPVDGTLLWMLDTPAAELL
ncbi:MAG: 6-phosphogluconolactonase [Saprospiraceae bacterium]|nr:6-phosphogluconolactonase [Saprospiraceae bacterium]